MFEQFLSMLPSQKSRDVASTAAGMLAVLAGRKVVGLSLFAKGVAGLEKHWREAHPDFQGGMDDRWQRAIKFYNETHSNDTNRVLHLWGIPLIVGGTAGLLLFRPYRPLWLMSASSFSVGWILNFIGHGIYEKKAPAFADDPLAFVAGPVWDLQQMMRKNKKTSPDFSEASSSNDHSSHAGEQTAKTVIIEDPSHDPVADTAVHTEAETTAHEEIIDVNVSTANPAMA